MEHLENMMRTHLELDENTLKTTKNPKSPTPLPPLTLPKRAKLGPLSTC